MPPVEGQDAADRYLDSLLNNKVYLNVWTLKECREMGIGLGLDLKGGMNVILEVSVPDVVKALADHKEETDENFRKAVEQATSEAASSQTDFITLFIKDYKALEPNKALAELFATQQLRDKVNTKSTDRRGGARAARRGEERYRQLVQRAPHTYRPLRRRTAQHPGPRRSGRPHHGRNAWREGTRTRT